MNRNKNYQLNYLSAKFYEVYNPQNYPEIEHKESRPYMVLLLQSDKNTFAIPFRTNISHNNCYRFKNSTRPTETVTGLDYSKAVIVNQEEYIGQSARINDKEYVELNDNYQYIIRQFRKYVTDYVAYVNGKTNYYNAKKFQFTTLKYFHNELGLNLP